jgi:hypothetical protein
VIVQQDAEIHHQIPSVYKLHAVKVDRSVLAIMIRRWRWWKKRKCKNYSRIFGCSSAPQSLNYSGMWIDLSVVFFFCEVMCVCVCVYIESDFEWEVRVDWYPARQSQNVKIVTYIDSESDSRYDRWSAGQSVLVSSPVWGSWPDVT